MVKGLKATSYAGKLKELGMLSLEERRVRGDCIQVWKYLNGISPYSPGLLQFVGDGQHRVTRHTSEKMNLMNPNAKLDVRKYSFTSRCVEEWNRLPHVVKSAQSLNDFKIEYDRTVLH